MRDRQLAACCTSASIGSDFSLPVSEKLSLGGDKGYAHAVSARYRPVSEVNRIWIVECGHAHSARLRATARVVTAPAVVIRQLSWALPAYVETIGNTLGTTRCNVSRRAHGSDIERRSRRKGRKEETTGANAARPVYCLIKRVTAALMVIASIFLTGCEAVGGLLGAGVGAAIKKDQEGEVSETFTHTVPRTKSAALTALKRMRVEVTSSEENRIKAKTKEDPVDIKLESVTEKSTRMTVKIGEGLKKDRPTAEEIIDQTKRALGETK